MGAERVAHRMLLHPATGNFFAKLISLLRDRYPPWRRTYDHSPNAGGVAGKPRVEERHGANSPRLRKAEHCRLVEGAAAVVAEDGPELRIGSSRVFPRDLADRADP